MKPSSLKSINSKAEKTKEHEYFYSKNESFDNEGSPNTFENNKYCEVTKTTKAKTIFVNNCIPNF